MASSQYGKNGNGAWMRITALVLAATTLVSGAATADEIHALVPPIIANAGLTELSAAYGKDTGVVITTKADEMGKLTDDIKDSVPPPDVIFLPTDQMAVLEKEGGLKKGSRISLGRVQIGLAVRPGAPHPDISTIAKLAAVLKTAKSVAYSNPASGSMQAKLIDALLNRPEFAGVNKVISTKGNGVAALARGETEMALQLEGEIIGRDGVELVGPLPAALNAFIDTDIAVPATAAMGDEGVAFVRYITRPDAAAVWKSHGLDRMP